jgi:hypothetical protein
MIAGIGQSRMAPKSAPLSILARSVHGETKYGYMPAMNIVGMTKLLKPKPKRAPLLEP